MCVSGNKVLVYDPRGNLLRQIRYRRQAPPRPTRFAALNADTSAAELDSALREKVTQSARGSTEPTSRVPAILTSGAWLTALPAGAEPLRRGAPFGVVNGNMVNLATSEALAERVIAGAGRVRICSLNGTGRLCTICARRAIPHFALRPRLMPHKCRIMRI